MSTLVAMLLMQYVVSVKAGLVNHVQGTVNVAEMEMVDPGQPIQTGRNGYAEILLNPGSFLRLGEDSEAVIDNPDLGNVTLTVKRGPAVIEVVEINKDSPITVTTGNLTARIVDTGIYRFENGTATVIQGKLETHDSKLKYEKGWQLFFQDNYRARKVPRVRLTGLDIYSQTRSAAIARANATLTSSLNGSTGYGYVNSWLYAPFIGMYTFIPHSGFRSPYGYQYYGIRQSVRRVVQGGGDGNAGGGSYTPPGNTGGGNSDNNGSGGGGGGGTAAPPTVSTPSGERSAPAVYIGGKDAPVGATSR